jgi:hypothetical protein
MSTTGSGTAWLPKPPRLTLLPGELDYDSHLHHDTQREPGLFAQANLLGCRVLAHPGQAPGRTILSGVPVFADPPVMSMSDAPQPIREPPMPERYPEDDWDGEDNDDEHPARNWDGRGWPTIERWWRV